MANIFKPNIYPIMYWALAFGVAAGILLFVLQLLSRYITVLWFPVFLAGLIYGGYRNYQKQKVAWAASAGVVPTADTPWNEFKQAAGDIAVASQELMEEEKPTEENQENPPAPPAPNPPPSQTPPPQL